MKNITLLTLGFLAVAMPGLAQITADQESRARKANFSRDPWVTFAIWSSTGGTRNPRGVGDTGECDVQRYNGGNWRSYEELYRAVDQTLRQLSQQPLQETLANVDSSKFAWTASSNGRVLASRTFGGNIVGNGGANVVAQGGGNLLNQDGSGVVGTAGGSYRVMSTATKKVFSLPGNRVLIIGK